MVNPNVEERNESENVDALKGSFRELLYAEKGNINRESINRKTKEVSPVTPVFFPPYPLFPTSSSSATNRMLCFGEENDYRDSVAVSVSLNSTQNRNPRTKKKAMTSIIIGGNREKEARRKRKQGSPSSATSSTEHKKREKIKNSPVSKTVRMGRERLGAHVKALQQLVSPMGKSDTASVLQETFRCIRFLHDQIKMLSCVYMEAWAESPMELGWRGAEGDLRRRGLCLVPISRTEL